MSNVLFLFLDMGWDTSKSQRFFNLNFYFILKVFMKKLEEKRVALNKAASMGEAILSICHPDSITTIKHWNTIIKARFEEVSPLFHAFRFNRTH